MDEPSLPSPATKPPAAIGPATRLNQVLDLHPDVLPYIVSLNPHDFQRLHNPLMRRLMPPRITLGRVAKMAGLPVEELLSRLTEITGVTALTDAEPDLPQSSETPPDWVENARHEDVPVIDLLPMDATLDADPMRPVMLAAKALPPGGVMVIYHHWEPQPFYDAWSRSGFEWFAEEVEPDLWHIWLRKLEGG